MEEMRCKAGPCVATKNTQNIHVPFYRAASMQGGVSHERNVRPSVKPVNCEKTKETYAKI